MKSKEKRINELASYSDTNIVTDASDVKQRRKEFLK